MKGSLHYLLMADHFLLQKALSIRLKGTGLTPGQPKILDYLKEHDGAVQKEIATGCHIEPASLTVILNGMEDKGYIERKTIHGNRRAQYVFLTDPGRQHAVHLTAVFDQLEEKALADFTTNEIETLCTLLSRVHDNLSKEKEATAE